jgi:hypothetical protein
MNAKPVTQLQKVSRAAWITCVLLIAVYLGTTIKTVVEYGWTLPWWTSNSAPTPDMQGNVVAWYRFSFWHSTVRQLLCYALFAGLFRAFEKGRIFTRQSVLLIQYLAFVYFASSLLNAVGPALFGLPANLTTQFAQAVENLLLPSVGLIAAWVMKEGSRIQDEQALTI